MVVTKTEHDDKKKKKKKKEKISQTDKSALNSVSKFRVSVKKKGGYEKIV